MPSYYTAHTVPNEHKKLKINFGAQSVHTYILHTCVNQPISLGCVCIILYIDVAVVETICKILCVSGETE